MNLDSDQLDNIQTNQMRETYQPSVQDSAISTIRMFDDLMLAIAIWAAWDFNELVINTAFRRYTRSRKSYTSEVNEDMTVWSSVM
jgi:hypothetical protein